MKKTENKKEQCTKILEKLYQSIPNPKTELLYDNPFELLIAVILSAHSTDVGVNKATRELFKVANTPEQILALGEQQLKQYIQSIGLYNTKAANILKTCKILVEQHDSMVPNSREFLEALPGVGRKTANVILNIIYNIPVIAVDTHIFRVANRTKMAEGKTPLEVETKLTSRMPENMLHYAHHLLVLHGRYVCTAKKPKCPYCVINDLCRYENKSVL